MTELVETAIHPTAEIADGAVIGPGGRIWQHCILLAGAVIGARVSLGHNVFVEGNVRIGDRVKVKDNVALYDGVILEDDVFVGPAAVFTNVANPRAFIEQKDRFEPTRVCRGATIGANATILCGVSIGCYALIGAGAVVTGDVADHALVAGNPGRRIGWVGRTGRRLGDDLVCPQTGTHYTEGPTGLTEAA